MEKGLKLSFRITYAIVALPIAIVTSYVLYQRCEVKRSLFMSDVEKLTWNQWYWDKSESG